MRHFLHFTWPFRNRVMLELTQTFDRPDNQESSGGAHGQTGRASHDGARALAIARMTQPDMLERGKR
jgi:hypothetical protein